ncbi:LOW QUALITY PROTEIN: hypothetical protein U0070_011864 [Myodes glareolus]|uniref:Uncharacterized protein n=1 Tax=Myodes glareolus TaxID=447135 RepID=A0AAW0K273_MYOGA
MNETSAGRSSPSSKDKTLPTLNDLIPVPNSTDVFTTMEKAVTHLRVEPKGSSSLPFLLMSLLMDIDHEIIVSNASFTTLGLLGRPS